MRGIHRSLIATAAFVLVTGVMFVANAAADESNGCKDESARCYVLGGIPGNCGYNASANACTCRGEVMGIPFEFGDNDCTDEIEVPIN